MKTILLLGSASIHGPEGPVTGRGQRARIALLAVLAASRGRMASRERLATLLWPDSDGDRSRHLVREAIYRLRELLGENALVSSGDELRLDESAVHCDVWQFERAVGEGNWAEADREYRGAFLDGLAFGSSAEFEQWLDAERARLAALHVRALERLAAECRERADWHGAVEVWRRRAAADPYNSRVALQIMEALDAAGDRGGALRHAVLHTELLASELGAAPDPNVAAFAERLRREPVLREAHRANGNGNGNGTIATAAAVPTEATSPLSDRGPEERLDFAEENPEARAWALPQVFRRRRTRTVALGVMAMTAGFFGMRTWREGPALADNRIAILPVRVSSTDPALSIVRDALVEFLPLQFTDPVGPMAVDPGEALAAWRRMDANQEESARSALRVARELGAGHVTTGALVGTPERFTVTIGVLSAKDGAASVAPVQIEGSMDSLTAVVTAIASRLRAPFTDARIGDLSSVNNAALRAFLDGMSEYRKGNWEDAGARLFRSFELDTTFVYAAYRFAVIHARTVPLVPLDTAPARFRGPTSEPRTCGGPRHKASCWLYSLLWSERHRLASEQRILLESVADSVNIFWHQEQLPRLEQTVNLLPNSAEAWELLGDAHYHVGSLLGRTDWAEQSRRAFERAWTLDSTNARKAPSHLADLAFYARDKRSHARYSRSAAGSEWPWENFTGSPEPPRGQKYRRYQAAILTTSPVAIRDARVEYSHAWARVEEAGADWTIRGMEIPPYELDSLLAQMAADANTDSQRRQVDELLSHAYAMSGRPSRAMELLRRSALPDSFVFNNRQMAWAEGDSGAAEQQVSLVLSRPVTGVMEDHPAACDAALSRLRRGDTTGAAEILAIQPPLTDSLDVLSAFAARYRRGVVAQKAICALVARGVLASLATSDITPLLRADSLMRVMPLNYADWWNYDLALALARHGEYGLAATAVRRHFHDTFPLQRLVLRLRQEGRWAALAGDTTSAIKALRQYLVWRSDPEPVFIPQRDSVRSELAALERGTSRWRRLLSVRQP